MGPLKLQSGGCEGATLKAAWKASAGETQLTSQAVLSF